jgi:hypothetical protein
VSDQAGPTIDGSENGGAVDPTAGAAAKAGCHAAHAAKNTQLSTSFRAFIPTPFASKGTATGRVGCFLKVKVLDFWGTCAQVYLVAGFYSFSKE